MEEITWEGSQGSDKARRDSEGTIGSEEIKLKKKVAEKIDREMGSGVWWWKELDRETEITGEGSGKIRKKN